MTADIESLVLERLGLIRSDIAELKREAVAVNVQLVAISLEFLCSPITGKTTSWAIFG